MSTPSASSARRVARTSSPVERFVRALGPVAIAANKSARCEIDLSPGSRSRPRNARAPPNATSSGKLILAALGGYAAGPLGPARCSAHLLGSPTRSSASRWDRYPPPDARSCQLGLRGVVAEVTQAGFERVGVARGHDEHDD